MSMFDRDKMGKVAGKIVSDVQRNMEKRQERVEIYKQRNSQYDTESLIKKFQSGRCCCDEEKFAVMQLLNERKNNNSYDDMF